MIPALLAGLFAIRWRPFPGRRRWLLFLPALWLGWEFVSATATISPKLTGPVVAHFSACAGFFYLGLFALRGTRNPWPVWAGLGLGLCWILHYAMEQHFGGLEATRKAVLEGKSTVSPALLADPAFLGRLNSNRVSGSFMYPNGLAAGLLLLLPVSSGFPVAAGPEGPGRRPGAVRRHLRVVRSGLFILVRLQSGLAGHGLVGCPCARPFGPARGLEAGFDSLPAGNWHRRLRFANTGTPWRAAKGAWRRGWFIGRRLCEFSGSIPSWAPGLALLARPMNKILPPNAELARLTHNDYLEQASDSGIIGFLVFTALISGSIGLLYRYRLMKNDHFCMTKFAVWLGLLGLFLHSGMEFNLYYPALAWPAFFLLGWLLGLEED